MGKSLSDMVTSQSETVNKSRVIAEEILMWIKNDEILAQKLTRRITYALQHQKPFPDSLFIAVFLLSRQSRQVILSFVFFSAVFLCCLSLCLYSAIIFCVFCLFMYDCHTHTHSQNVHVNAR